MEEFAVETRQLHKVYNAGKEDKIHAVNGIDLCIPHNTIYALLGPNGAGKTTTLSMLTTLIKPTGGSARVAGYDVVREAEQVRRRIGVTFQEIVLDDDLTGRQLLDYHGRLYRMGKEERQARIAELLALVELDAPETRAADRVIKGYSGGMKRRLELVRGLMSGPQILFLDEPTQGLDPQNRAKIWSYIRDLRDKRGLTLLLTTHYMEEAEALADVVGIIDHGQLVVEGAPQALIAAMGADVIRVAGSGDAAALAPRLEALAFVQGVNVGEHVIQVGVDNGNRRLAQVITLLGEDGFQIEDISVAKPTLGDVFIKHTGRQLRDK